MHEGVRPKESLWIKSWGLTPLPKINSSGLSPGRSLHLVEKRDFCSATSGIKS